MSSTMEMDKTSPEVKGTIEPHSLFPCPLFLDKCQIPSTLLKFYSLLHLALALVLTPNLF